MLAAAQAARAGNDTVLVEKNEKLGKKLFITGKGRCNVTNACDIEDFFANIAHNKSFCYSAVYSFNSDSTKALIENNGVPLKTERGNRVFPQSDKSSDIIKALEKNLKDAGVRVMLRTKLDDMTVSDNAVTGVILNGRAYRCDKLILALGGASYASTGSDGEWKNKIEALGHTVEPFRPALVPLTSNQAWVRGLQGLSLKNVTLKAVYKNRTLYEELGEMLFTHFGVSGPLVLTLSSVLEKPEFDKLNVYIDLKPGLNEDQLDARILRDFSECGGKTLKNACAKLLPSRLISAVISNAGLDENEKISQFTAEKRKKLVQTLKKLEIKINGFGDINEAIITRGGVNVKEIDPSTMQSKLIKNLYFCGEMIDIDAFTGGFNIQLALSTGFSAGNDEDRSHGSAFDEKTQNGVKI